MTTEEKVNRKNRRVLKGKFRENKPTLSQIATLVSIWLKEPAKIKAWIYAPSDEFGGDSPLEKALKGDGNEVVAYLAKQVDNIPEKETADGDTQERSTED